MQLKKIGLRISVFTLLLFTFCTSKVVRHSLSHTNRPKKETIERDFDGIKKDGKLKAITTYGMTSYFLYKGETMGFEYELLRSLANHLGLELEIIVVEDVNEVIQLLNSGEGDIIAKGLTITEERKEQLSFTKHHYKTHQVLVQKKPDNWRSMSLQKVKKQLITDVIDLIGDTISIQRNSPYYNRINNLSSEIGGRIFIDTLPSSLTNDEIIEMVADGKIKYTVADYNLAAINKSYYPDLDIETSLSLSQRIAWATRKNSPLLNEAINEWVDSMKNEVDYYVIYNKYFKAKKSFKKRVQSEYYSSITGKISPYDEIIKKYSEQICWDWRLISSIIYQESQFKPNNRSWVGAQGLMQIMPATAKELGIKNPNNPEQSVKGGTKYLEQIWNQWDDIEDSTQRIKFVLASYNCGYYHVRDAQNLALKNGDDSLFWDNAVENYILKLSSKEYYTDPVVKYGYVRGKEPYNYVHEILDHYKHYVKFVDNNISAKGSSKPHNPFLINF